MTEPWENGEEHESGGQLRQRLEEALSKVKEAEAAKSAAEKALGERVLADTLKEMGVNKPNVAKNWILKDKAIDIADQTAVKAWVESNAEDFGFQFGEAQAQAPAPTPSQPSPEAQDASDLFRADFERAQQVQNLAQAEVNDKLALAERGLDANATPEQVYAALRQAGL